MRGAPSRLRRARLQDAVRPDRHRARRAPGRGATRSRSRKSRCPAGSSASPSRPPSRCPPIWWSSPSARSTSCRGRRCRRTVRAPFPCTLRGVTVRGKGEQIRYALEHTPALVTLLENYFGRALSVRQAGFHRRGRFRRRRHGERGRHRLSRDADADERGLAAGTAPRAMPRSPRTRFRTCGSAISSPPRGGTTSG